MDKRVREISRFFVVPPRMFPLFVCARPRVNAPFYPQIPPAQYIQHTTLLQGFKDEDVGNSPGSRADTIQLTAKPLNPIAAPLAAVEGACFSVTGYLALTEQVTN